MSQTSSFVFDGLPSTDGPSPDATVVSGGGSSTVDQIINTVGDVGNVATKIDQVLHPSKYQQSQSVQNAGQQQPQAQHSGFGWTGWLLLAAGLGTGGYYLKEHLQGKKSK